MTARVPSLVWAVCVFTASCARPGGDSVVCTFDYGGETTHARFDASADPYLGRLVPIADEFAFRGVYVKSPADVARVALSAYYVGDRGPVLLEKTRYYPPFPRPSAASRYGFTGLRALYAPEGHELQYWCQWQ
ncbi:MAG: hypothetical protein ABJB12_21275 [Pseudomonadota bacterium]